MKAYQELEQRFTDQASHVQSNFELEELNQSIMAQIRDLEGQRETTLDNMTVIIRKNDDLQRELSILTRALELQTQAQQAEVDKVKEQNAELAAQVAEEQRKVEELQFIREQDNQEVTRIEVELIKISQLNNHLQ